ADDPRRRSRAADGRKPAPLDDAIEWRSDDLRDPADQPCPVGCSLGAAADRRYARHTPTPPRRLRGGVKRPAGLKAGREATHRSFQKRSDPSVHGGGRRMSHIRRFISLVAGCALSAIALSSASAEYPDKPITAVVPFDVGGATDILARMISSEIAKKLNAS